MIEYKHILAVIDLEREDHPALQRALELSEKTGATVTALLVVYDLSYDMTTMLSPEEREASAMLSLQITPNGFPIALRISISLMLISWLNGVTVRTNPLFITLSTTTSI